MDDNDITRRDFVNMTVAAGLAAAAGSDLAGQQHVVETNVEIKTPDGTCDAAFIHPASGAQPAVIIWPDAFGLRPSMRGLARRLAADGGYSVLVPTPFYRVAKAHVLEDAAHLRFADAAERSKRTPLLGRVRGSG